MGKWQIYGQYVELDQLRFALPVLVASDVAFDQQLWDRARPALAMSGLIVWIDTDWQTLRGTRLRVDTWPNGTSASIQSARLRAFARPKIAGRRI
jgi:hypothetical protein